MKNLYNLRNFEELKIYLASAQDVLDWSYGEVTKPETINYRTFKPERDGLFDERIFGPVKNFECYCGKYKGIRYKDVVCDKCGVQVTHSRVRRDRMGHIKLASSVAHVWFFRGIPSKMALLLDLSPRSLESIIYFSSFIITAVDYEKKAAAISQIDLDLEKAKEDLQNEIDLGIADTEHSLNEDTGKMNDLKAQETAVKLKQKLQSLRNAGDKRIENLEKEYKLMQKKVEGLDLYSVISDAEYLKLYEYIDIFCTVGIGAEAVQDILISLDLDALSSELSGMLENAKGQKAAKINKRLKVVEQFRRANIAPDRMIVSVLPVIPPDLRPMVQLEGGRFATSDLNDLYRRVINRNNRLRKLLDLGAPDIIVRNEKRMLQESVDALFDSSKQRQKQRVSRGRKELKSLADMLKGKQGIFRLNLLGKRVDYSGRGVIINGPSLKLNECGLPKEMGLELFKPFVLQQILARGFAPNIKSAKYVLEQRGPEVWDILEDVVVGHPVLLNRAPTLWRLGIQAFYPKLIDGNAIRLHLCVCAGFNADFDGDQMAVHVPLSKKAVQEARELMISTSNLLNPSNGEPISIPSKTLLFGVYYLTAVDPKLPVWKSVFADTKELIYMVRSNPEFSYKRSVKVRINGEIVETTAGRVMFNEATPAEFGFLNHAMDKKKIKELLGRAFRDLEQERVVELIDAIKDLGLKYGTMSGNSVALSDIKVPETRDALLSEGRAKVADINKNFRHGLTTKEEVQRLTENVWSSVINNVDEAAWNQLEDDNPMKILVSSGATRASRDQVRQIAGMKGLVSDPTGRIVPMPIMGNFKLGLSGLEYFVAARGARKGLVDKGLKTADAGYLTRRLVDVAQDVIIREHDCGTDKGRKVTVGANTILQSFDERYEGRYLLEDIVVDGKVIVSKDDILTHDALAKIQKAGVAEMLIRSPMTCASKRGMCQRCYGKDIMKRSLVGMGVAVGVQAAQSIGEPGTQLTMRTFHSGGIAGKDITNGLPRVEEIVEARAPKSLSIMSEITGTVKISEAGDERKIYITAVDKNEEQSIVDYMIDPVAEILVEDGALVTKGEKLTAGHLDLTELLRTVGVEKTREYIIDEIQRVYTSQGVALNDKHLEVIVKQMFNNVKIEVPGDSKFLEGEIITKASFLEENERVLASGGSPASATVTLLGITKTALYTDSFLSSASFIQTSTVLTDSAASGRVDNLLGLKENVIIGRLIPTGESLAAEEIEE